MPTVFLRADYLRHSPRMESTTPPYLTVTLYIASFDGHDIEQAIPPPPPTFTLAVDWSELPQPLPERPRHPPEITLSTKEPLLKWMNLTA